MSLDQIEFPTLIFTVLANLSLAFLVIRNNGKDVSKIIFSILALTLAVWSVVNYFSIHSPADQMLTWIRLVMFFATPQAFLFFLFVHTFPQTKLKLSKGVFATLLLLTIIVSVLSLSSLVFSHISTDFAEATPIAGPAMPIFGIVTGGYILSGIFLIGRRYRRAEKTERRQWQFISTGLLITLLMLFIFVFLFVTILKVTELVNLAPIFTLPLILFMTYAIFKHHLLNIKVLAAELLTLVIVFILFVQSFEFDSIQEFLFKFFFAVIVTILGVQLVKSVNREVKQREQLELLSKELKVVNSQLGVANKKLKKLDEAKTEFLSITSHQLRTPLSGIKGYMSMLVDGDFGKFSKEQGDVLGRVKAEVDRLIRLVQVFLNVSRIESGRLQVDKIESNLADLADTVITELTPTAEAAGLKLHYKDVGDIPVVADVDKLKDVVVNLVDNAIKYTQKGSVTLAIEDLGKEVKLSVSDTGVGIDPKEITELFNKFKRAKGIAQVSASGSGLGLFIAKKIIEGHQGKIWAESPGKGKGSSFIFTIPKKPKPAPKKKAPKR